MERLDRKGSGVPSSGQHEVAYIGEVLLEEVHARPEAIEAFPRKLQHRF